MTREYYPSDWDTVVVAAAVAVGQQSNRVYNSLLDFRHQIVAALSPLLAADCC